MILVIVFVIIVVALGLAIFFGEEPTDPKWPDDYDGHGGVA